MSKMIGRRNGRRGTVLKLLAVAAILSIGGGLFWDSFRSHPWCPPLLPFGWHSPPPRLEAFDAPSDLPVPQMDDWREYGPVLKTGAEGEWDFGWAGHTPASVVKKDGTFYFYYVASDGYRSFDGGPRNRAIGLATSNDGIRFEKYVGNPVMVHRPNNGEEEGANSAGVTLDEHGEFVMVYGAATGPANLIVADGRVAFSSDGLSFADAGRSLYHCDRRIYGFGDEIFPLAVFRNDSRWFVFYQPNGIPGTERTLGAAWGPSLDSLKDSTIVLNGESGGIPVDVWGNVIRLDDETLVFFSQRLWWPNTFVEVRVASPDTPYHLSRPIVRYDIANLKRGVVFLDKDRRTWFMYYNDFSRFWRLKLAPFGPPDTTPPTAPQRLMATPSRDGKVALNWQAASDSDTGVVIYRVYRDAQLLGSTKEFHWIDTGQSELAEYDYAVTAVNFHGVEGPPAKFRLTTPSDATPPTIVRVSGTNDLKRIQVVFSKVVDLVTATDPENYSISNEVEITKAELSPDGRAVTLSTSAHQEGKAHRLTAGGVLDRAKNPNPLALTERDYTPGPIAGLVGRWLFDAAAGHQGRDGSGFGRPALVSGAIPGSDRSGALHFNGLDSYIQINGGAHLKDLTSGSFTFAAWVRPEAAPDSGMGARILGRIGEHPTEFYGISFTRGRRFRAYIFHPRDLHSRVDSPPARLQEWHHLAMVVDSSAKELHLYVDGLSVPSSPQSYASELVDLWTEQPRDDRSGAYLVGASTPDRGAGKFFDAFFTGAIADVRFYDRALGALEIQVLARKGSTEN